MQRSSPDLSISAAVDGGELVFTFQTQTAECRVRASIGEGQLDECRTAFNAGLRRFRAAIGSDIRTVRWGSVSKALQHLHTAGRQFMFQVFGREQSRASAFVQAALPAWRRSATDGYRLPLVELRARTQHVIPFELLPLLDPSKPRDISNADDLVQLAARFIGFSAVVYRAASGGPPVADVLDNEPSLRVRFFHHAGLRAARTERQFFERAGWIDFRGPWPAEALEEEPFLQQLVSYLWHAAEWPLQPSTTLDHVHHFACHCNTERKDSTQHSLDLADTYGLLDQLGWSTHVRKVHLGDMQAEFSSRLVTPRRSDATPLVFLNACGTSHVTSGGVGSFPEVFLAIGNCGVIGTETRIPDAFAAAFSEKFYLTFIRGHPVGTALFTARWSLLKHLQNPLGILYTLFGSPDIHVRRAQIDAATPLAQNQEARVTA